MNDDCRKIFEMLAALNARLEMNEHLTRQMDEQLALLNLKREEELEELRSTLKNLTAAFAAMTSELAQKSDVPPIVQDNSALAKTSDDLQAIHAAIDEIKTTLAAGIDNAEIARAVDDLKVEVAAAKTADDLKAIRAGVDDLKTTLAAGIDNAEIARAVDDLKVEVAAAKAADDLQAIRAAVEELKIALKNSSRADDFVTIRMALQNTSVAINDIKKRVDGIKFDTSKKFNELALNSEINHKALAAAVSEIKTEVAKIAAAFEPEPDPDFEVSTWWSGNKER